MSRNLLSNWWAVLIAALATIDWVTGTLPGFWLFYLWLLTFTYIFADLAFFCASERADEGERSR